MGTTEDDIRQELERVKSGLRQRCANITCEEACRLLIRLGFEVKNGKKGGHKVYTHDHLPDFISGSLDCGHKRNGEIKPNYIRKIVSILSSHEDDLVEYMRQENRS